MNRIENFGCRFWFPVTKMADFFEGNIQSRYFREEKMKISRKDSYLQGDKPEVEVISFGLKVH